jgi:hypothetical protein
MTSSQTPRSGATAKVELGNTRVVVANLVVVVLPRVEVKVLVEGTATDRRADEHVVEGLAVVVEQVRVAVGGFDADNLLQVDKPGDGQEVLDGQDLGKFVVITGRDDAGGGVQSQDLGNEVLVCKLAFVATMGQGKETYGGDLRL